MPLSPEQWKQKREARKQLEPQERRTAALEEVADNLRFIYDAVSELRVELSKAASSLGKPKF